MEKNKSSIPFVKLNLHESLLFALFVQKYYICSDIQHKTIPALLENKNVLVHSETGSGKTLCFIIPLLQHLLKVNEIPSKQNLIKTQRKGKDDSDQLEKKSVIEYDEESIEDVRNFFLSLEGKTCKSIIPGKVESFLKYHYQRTVEEEKCLDKVKGKIKKYSIEDLKNKIYCKPMQKKKKEIVNIAGIIIAPTREICKQIYEVIKKTIFFMNVYFEDSQNNMTTPSQENFFIGAVLCRGSVKINEELEIIKKEKKKNRNTIIISTPGKLAVLLNEYNEHFDLNNIKYFVLDEGDKLLEDSFIGYIKDISKHLLNDYISCICSATCLQEEKYYNLFSEKNKEFFKCVSKVDTEVSHFQMPERIENYYMILRTIDKNFFLFKFLHTVVKNNESVIVFFSTCFCVDFFFLLFEPFFQRKKKKKKNVNSPDVCEKIWNINKKYNLYEPKELIAFFKMISYLKKYKANRKINLMKIHGKMTVSKRNKAFNKITNKGKNEINVIFCTDVMSRGVNMNVQWVISYDVPNKNLTYVHRGGRTGRFNEFGKNIIFLNKKEEEYIYFLKNKNVDLINFKTTDMYKQLVNYEKEIMKEEETINRMTRQIINTNNILPSTSFNTQIKPFYNKGKRNNEKNRKRNEQQIGRKENIVLQNYMVYLFSKCFLFFVVEYRETYLLSKKAFLSYLEFYKNHQIAFICSYEKLNLMHLSFVFGLVKMPKLKDKWKIKNKKNLQIDTSLIAYQDKEKEKRRQEHLKMKKERQEKELKKLNEKKNKNKNKEEEEGEEEDASNEEDSETNKSKKQNKKSRNERKKEKREAEQNDIDSLFYEEKLYKKLKQKKISQEEYERLMSLQDLDDEALTYHGKFSKNKQNCVFGYADKSIIDRNQRRKERKRKGNNIKRNKSKKRNKGKRR